VIEENRTNQLTTQSTITFSNTHLDDASMFDGSTDPKVSKEEAINSSKEDVNKENDEHDEECTFPYIYIIPDIPPKVQRIIDKGEIHHFRGHTNVRRLLLDAIFTDVTTTYSLLLVFITCFK
jgi:hypothetical protein